MGNKEKCQVPNCTGSIKERYWNCGECGRKVCDECINTGDESIFDYDNCPYPTEKIPEWFCEDCRENKFHLSIL